MNHAIIILGSNAGDRRSNINNSLKLLLLKGNIIIKKSSVIETEPEGVENHPVYLNAAAVVGTKLDLESFFKLTQKIEKELGRDNKGQMKPRTIDIDIAFFNHLVVQTPQITIPHPGSMERKFSRNLLREICPDYVHPIAGKTLNVIFKED